MALDVRHTCDYFCATRSISYSPPCHSISLRNTIMYSAIIISLFVKIFFPKAPIGIFYVNLALKARFSCGHFLHQTLASDNDEEACLTKLLSSARQTKYVSILKIQC